MKRIRIIAIVSAIVTALAVYLYLMNVKKPVDVVRGPVVVAVNTITAGQEIKAEMVEVKNLPVEAINPKAARSVDEVIGRVSSAGAEPGEQLLVSRFYRAGESNNTLAYAIERGKRAFTVEVDRVSGVSGLVKPRDHVDILAILTVKEQLWRMNATISHNSADVSIKLTDPEERTYSLLPLQNLLVLATGQVMQADAKNEQTTVDQVTLAVTPEQAVILNFLVSCGQIKLALRSPVDTDTVDIEPKDINDIMTVSTMEELLAELNRMYDSSGALPTPAPTAKP